jgi:hypothetical protein
MRPLQPSRPPCDRYPSLIRCSRTAALDSGFRCMRECAQRSSHATPRSLLAPFPPVPPASRNGWGTAQATRKRGRVAGSCRWESTSSAKEPAFLMASARKSLIVETNTSTSRIAFATSRPVFATNPFFASAAVAPFFSLSKLLKEEKKEDEEEGRSRAHHVPRVSLVLPSVSRAAYFLGHESAAEKSLTRGNSWRTIHLIIKYLSSPSIKTTIPRVALRVVPLCAPKGAI